ncbi:MAG: hypothetical protein AAF623_14520 [Planctomycetota bacterium]
MYVPDLGRSWGQTNMRSWEILGTDQYRIHGDRLSLGAGHVGLTFGDESLGTEHLGSTFGDGSFRQKERTGSSWGQTM